MSGEQPFLLHTRDGAIECLHGRLDDLRHETRHVHQIHAVEEHTFA